MPITSTILIHALILFGLTGSGEVHHSVNRMETVEQCQREGREISSRYRDTSSFADVQWVCVSLPLEAKHGEKL